MWIERLKLSAAIVGGGIIGMVIGWHLAEAAKVLFRWLVGL